MIHIYEHIIQRQHNSFCDYATELKTIKDKHVFNKAILLGIIFGMKNQLLQNKQVLFMFEAARTESRFYLTSTFKYILI